MLGERVPEGWLVRLKPRGAGRFVSAGFLFFWLCGWAIGESIVLWLLAKGALALMFGEPPAPGRAPLELGPSVAVGAFLLLWLSLWTLGGIAAMSEVLRLLWSEDRILAHHGGLTVTRFRGPFRWRRELPRDGLRRVILVTRCESLAVETERERIELSSLGTPAERVEAVSALRSELGLNEADSGVPALPKGWEEVITPEGDRVVAPDVRIRKIQARVAGVVALGFAGIAIALIHESMRNLTLLPMAALAALAALALAAGAVWLARGRMEWRVGSGRIILRRRFGPNARDLFEARRLALGATTDSDGDTWFNLEAIRDPADALPPGGPVGRAGKDRRRVVSAYNDPTVPRLIGAWLAKAANVPLADHVPTGAREVDLSELRDQLDKSGPLGRIAARLLSGAVERRQKRV